MRLEMTGKYELFVKRDGYIYHYQKGKNLVTSAGENLVAELLDHTATPNEPQYVALGSGSVGPLKSDVTLGSEHAGTRTASGTPVRTLNVLLLPFSFTAAGPLTINEVGIFNASAAGDMMSRFLIQTIAIAASDLLEIDWSLTISGVD